MPFINARNTSKLRLSSRAAAKMRNVERRIANALTAAAGTAGKSKSRSPRNKTQKNKNKSKSK